MLIYDEHHWFRQSYSSINRNAIKYFMKQIKKTVVSHDIFGGIISVPNNRFLHVRINHSEDKHDFYMLSRIYSRYSLSLKSNHSPFYEIDRDQSHNHLHFRKGLYCIPLTFTSQFLNDASNHDLYRTVTVELYEKKMKVKLGFCGSHLDKHKTTSYMDRW